MYVYGKNVIKELLANKSKINKVILSSNMENTDIEKDLKKINVEIKYLKSNEMDRIVSANHQGVIADIDDYEYLSEKQMLDNLNENPFIVILDHLEDTHNFGAIIRTCEAAGVDFLIIPKNRSVSVNGVVMKTSVGAALNVRIVEVTNLNNIIEKLKKKGIWIVGTDMEDSKDYDEIDYKIPIALVIGSEGFGISRLVRENCDFIAKIPMYGKINSLNASVAAGIMIYEVVRQRRVIR